MGLLSKLHELEQRQVARLAAVGLPALVLAGAWWGVSRYEGPSIDGELTELANEGQVINGEHIDDDIARYMDVALDLYEPSVLVLGNSTAQTNVSVDALADGLGIPRDEILVLAQPNSVASHWYAVLNNIVYANGHRPQIVVVMGSLRSALQSEPYSAASRQALLATLRPEEPLLDHYVDRAHPAIENLRWRRLQLHTQLLTSVRDLVVDLVFLTPAQPAMDRVFHHSNLVVSPQRGFLIDPGAELAGSVEGAAQLPNPEASLLPALADLTRRHGSTLVLVRPPMAARTPVGRRDITLAEVPDQVYDVLAARGHRFVDLGDVWLPGGMYDNLTHLDEHGAEVFTRRAVAPAVRQSLRVGPELPVTPELIVSPAP